MLTIEEIKVFKNKGVGVMTISWTSTPLGFGEVTIQLDKNGKVEIDTESMGKKFFLKLMSKLYDKAEVE